jgi:hypothetical protein
MQSYVIDTFTLHAASGTYFRLGLLRAHESWLMSPVYCSIGSCVLLALFSWLWLPTLRPCHVQCPRVWGRLHRAGRVCDSGWLSGPMAVLEIWRENTKEQSLYRHSKVMTTHCLFNNEMDRLTYVHRYRILGKYEPHQACPAVIQQIFS